MAAYAALVSLLNDLELIPNHPTHSFSFDNEQLSSLSQTVEFLIDFMETYNSHGCTTEAAEALETRITYAAHAAHDVIESHLVDQIQLDLTKPLARTRFDLLMSKICLAWVVRLAGACGRTRSCFLPDLQRAIQGMEFVRTETMQFIAKSGSKAEQPRYSAASSTSSTEPLLTGNKKEQPRYSAAPSTSSTEPLLTGNKKKNAMVGFDSVLLRLLDILTGEPSDQRSVVPIVGMGGIGKTTLARNAYDHSYIQEHFDLLLWATISQEFSIQTILMELLFGVRNSTASGSVYELGEELRKKKLWGRRYLVVLDDMWSVDAWDVIQMYLPDNGNGSRVIITTRLSNLATTHLSSSSPFEMKFLDEGESWELFCGKAFGGEEGCPIELEEIGKKIVERCRGLPLSIVVIGGHLRKSPRAIEYWERLSKSINPISSVGRDDQCLEILRLSYQHLPARLKPCFLYLGVFKEDHWINVPQLLRYWVCEGFIKPKRGLIDLEEAAEDYLEDLIDRNLVLVRTRRWNGKVEACAIHDVVRELCLKVGKKEKFIGVAEDSTGAKGCEERRIVVPADLSSVRQHRAGGLELPLLLRSLVCQGSWYLDELSVDFRLLRVSANIDLDRAMLFGNDMYCPTCNFQQVNIRHLVFYVPSVKLPYCIPSSISLLWNLHTLTVSSDFRGEISAPSEIWKVPQIRHLQFHRLCLPNPLPSDGSNQEECIVLRNLHTLIGVVDLKLTEEVCKRIPNIKKLKLVYLTLPEGDGGKEASSSYYCLHNLGHLNKLESLDCYFGQDSEWRDVFQSLTFPSSLVELTIGGCHWEDLTKMIKSIPQLGYLELMYVSGSEWDLAEEEEFPHLRILKISYTPCLIRWNASSSNFPVLEELHIYSSELSEIPFDLGEIPTLRLIHLRNCSVPCALSAVRIAVEQEDVGNEDLQLRVRFDKMEEVERFQKMMGEEGLISHSLSLYHWGDKIKA